MLASSSPGLGGHSPPPGQAGHLLRDGDAGVPARPLPEETEAGLESPGAGEEEGGAREGEEKEEKEKEKEENERPNRTSFLSIPQSL